MVTYKNILILLIVCLLNGKVLGESRYVTYQQKDGLASNTVDAIEQDSEGYLYFCTNEGLSVFDGHSFLNYDLHNTPGFSNYITSLIELDDYHLLIGSQDKGLFLYDKYLGEIRPLDENGVELQGIKAIVKTSDGFIWIGCSDGSLWYIDGKEVLNGSLEGITISRVDYPFPPINALTEKEDELIVATSSSLVSVKANNKLSPFIIEKIHSTDNNPIYSLETVGQNDLWVGTNNGILLFSKRMNGWTLSNILLRECIVRSIVQFDNRIYAGTEGNGVHEIYFQENVPHTKKLDYFDSIKYILSLKSDKAGNLWIGTWLDGIRCLTSRSPHYLLTRNDILNDFMFSNVVWAIAKDKQTPGGYFLGTLNSGLCKYVVGEASFKSIDKTYSSIHTLYTDSISPYLYVGTWGNGLRIFNPLQGYYEKESFPEISDARIYSITRHSNNLLFIGTSNKGAWLLDESTHSLTPLAFQVDSLKAMNVRGIVPDRKDNGYWMASFDAGLFHFKLDRAEQPTEITHYPMYEDASLQITYLCPENDRLWICTTTGLFYLDYDSESHPLQKVDELNGFYLTSMLKMGEHEYWLSSHEGAVHFDANRMLLKKFLTENTHYTLLYEQTDSLLFSGSSSGLFSFYPQDVDRLLQQGRALIRSLQINGKNVAASASDEQGQKYTNQSIVYADTLMLPPGKSTVRFMLAALSDIPLIKHTLFYKMNGLEDYWNQVDIDNAVAVYNNIPPGEYVLNIRLNSPDNLKGQKELL